MTFMPFGTPSRRRFLAGAAALIAPGCAAIQQPEPPQLYVLRPDLSLAMGTPVNWGLAVATPDATASLDTARIALSRSPTTMDYFADAAWTDRVPLLVQRMLIQAFDGTGRIISVDRDTAGLETDYLLETEIREFQARYDTPDSAPLVLVGIQAKLVRMPQREIAAGTYANEQSQAAGNTIDGIVLAFNQAAGSAISKIVGWTLNQPGPA